MSSTAPTAPMTTRRKPPSNGKARRSDRPPPRRDRGGPINCLTRTGAIWFLWSQVPRVSVNVETRQVVDYSRQLHCFAAPSNGSHWPHSKGSFKMHTGSRRKKSMGNIPGLSVTVGWTEDVAGVIQGIAWEMFNSTDKDMEVNINAVPVQGTPPLPIDTDLPEGVTVSPNWNTIGFLVVPRGVYNLTVQPVNGPTYLVATDVLVPIGRHRI